MYILTYMYILPEISAYHLQLAAIFVPGHPYIESTTVLSDITCCRNIYIIIYNYIIIIPILMSVFF